MAAELSRVRQLDLPLMQALQSNKIKQERRHGLENFGAVYAPVGVDLPLRRVVDFFTE